MTTIEPRAAHVPASTSIPAYYRLLLRGQLTRGRLVALAALAGISVLLAALSRGADDSVDAGLAVLAVYGVGILVPLAAVLLGVPMLGNMIEDRLLVYLWLKPVPRWHLAVAAVAAVASVLFPVVVLPVGLSAAVAGLGGLVGPAVLACALGALAYGAVFVFLGARFSWGLWLALVYVGLWEAILSGLSDGTGRLSIRSYLVTILEWGTERNIDLGGRSDVAAIVVPLAIAAVGTALAAWTLRSRDVD